MGTRSGLLAAIVASAALVAPSTAAAVPYLYTSNTDGSVAQFDATTGGLVPQAPATVAGGNSSTRGNGVPLQPAVSPDAASL